MEPKEEFEKWWDTMSYVDGDICKEPIYNLWLSNRKMAERIADLTEKNCQWEKKIEAERNASMIATEEYLKTIADLTKQLETKMEIARHPFDQIQRLEKQIADLTKKVGELEIDVDFYKKSMERIANLFGITSPMQLIVEAKNDEQTYVDILIEHIKRKIADLTKKVDELTEALNSCPEVRFVRHIESHFPDLSPNTVMCKICGKHILEIAEEKS